MMSRTILSQAAAAAMSLAAFAGSVGTAAAAPPSGQPGCRLRIDSASPNWIVEGYDPFGTDNAPQASYDVMFTNDGDANCRFLPRFVTDGSALGLDGGGSTRVSYTLLNMTSGVNVTPIAGRSPLQSNSPYIEIAPGQQQLVRYELKIDAAAVPGDGKFTQRLFLTAEEGLGNDIVSKPFVVGINIKPSALVGLSGAFRRSNGQADIDLGELRTGVVAIPLQLHVLSTRAYDLQFQSRNGGKLRLADNGQWAIPYSLIVDDKRADLSGGAPMTSSPVNLLRLDNLPIAFDIGPVEGMRAGTYSDLITVSVSVK